MVCHSDCHCLHHSLLPATDFQSDENFYHHLHQKDLDVPFWQIHQYFKLFLLPVLYCTTTAVLHFAPLQRQCCNLCCLDEILSQFACPQYIKIVLILCKILRTLSYIKETQLNTPKVFQIKIDDNSNLILIWPHRHFQQNVKVVLPKIPVLKPYQNVLPVCHHWICLWFKYQYLDY